MPVRWAALAVAVIRTVFRWFTRAREYQIALGLATQELLVQERRVGFRNSVRGLTAALGRWLASLPLS
jgi:hypothetical protein